ncbi:MAG: GNAT superfamily N-acetyltransferase [Oceanospirillaceae bacterium]|jgi:GNAT superfamily N-acetyltransferase
MQFLLVDESDLEDLVALRIGAMRPSLEVLGRFDAVRARERFVKNFDAPHTYKIVDSRQLLGFYVLLKKQDHLWLDHLYIDIPHQGGGIGGQIIQQLQQQAQQKQFPLRLGALKESPANDFYIKQGFKKIEIQEWDNIYQWDPKAS